MRLIYYVFLILVLLLACRTEIPFDPGPLDPDPMDTIGVDTTDTPVDSTTVPGDSTIMDTSMLPCDSSLVYFDRDILPILKNNCAISGCHDPISAQHGLILNSYEGLISPQDDLVVPFDLDESELYKKITEDDADDRMPPPPKQALTQGQISLIGKWILQGAKNNSCSDTTINTCDTAMVSYLADVKPIFDTYCVSCHGNTNPNAGVSLSAFGGVSPVAKSGKLLGVIRWTNGFIQMPLGGSKIPPCDINTIEAWINQGVLNN